jgi:hypothetical protein
MGNFERGIAVVGLGFCGAGLILCIVSFTAIFRAHVVYDGRPPEENYAFFLSECAKARFDEQQCEFLGRAARITGRPMLEEKGERL